MVIYCKRCLMPSTRPRISFDKEGICNACRNAENKWEGIDWQARKKEFLDLLGQYRSENGSWDCIVPWSGGKDSSAVAYKLKYEFGMNPLMTTFSPQLPTDVGNYNREMMVQLGFDHLFFRPNQRIHRRLSRRFFIERGNHKVAWDAGVNTIPVQAAVNYKVPLVFYAEHGESEYGGKVLKEESKKLRDFTEVIEHQIGDDPRNWVDDKITAKDLNPYLYPGLEEVRKVGVKALYFGYFFKWSSYENFLYIKEKFDFKTCPTGRSEGTYTDFDSLDDKSDNLYYYMQFIKFGFGRAVRDASRMIQNKQLTREQGLELAKKYDDEFPAYYFKDMLEYLDLTEKDFHEIVDKHRNPEIWKKEGGKWQLRYPLR
ncbi:MAG: N-acetyl sugar amidotransferase [Candidatus Omnitrophica bacterium]|nr:N-acetyl sugar amidotransferase [Candidatus Omnitrophota bacterium]MDD5310574.1 N-acetyl sugar amidotransferase [Candidatus Omnitrophota bacterium]MDD5546000.1 N-acetyl sugar amidotransferase [Candidatus Omnitrophota bacterium]